MTRSLRRPLSLVVALVLGACGPGAPSATPSATTQANLPAPDATATTGPTSPTPGATRAPISLLPAAPEHDVDGATAARLQGVLYDLVLQGNPDVIAAVITADGAWAGAAGVDGPDNRHARPTDMFSIASVSKPILAALVLKLDQDGVIDIESPLSTYLGDLDVNANGATVREALAMRAGIGDTPEDAVAASKQDCSRAWTRAETLPSIPAPTGAAGKAYVYSNPTYKLLGLAAEEALGTSLDQAFRDQLFEPLGLGRMLVQTGKPATPKPWALPIAGREGALRLEDFGRGGALPCLSIATFSFQNAVASDALSLARWAWALFEGRIVDRAHLTEMTTTASGNWGLGLERLSGLGQVAFGTAGHQDGYNAFFAVLPSIQVVVVVFINNGNADAEQASHELVNALDG